MAIIAEDFEQVARAIDAGAQPLFVDIARDSVGDALLAARRHHAERERQDILHLRRRTRDALGLDGAIPAVRRIPITRVVRGPDILGELRVPCRIVDDLASRSA